MVHQITLPTQRKYIEILVTNMRITVISIDLHGASKVKLDVTNYGRFVFNYSYLTSVSRERAGFKLRLRKPSLGSES